MNPLMFSEHASHFERLEADTTDVGSFIRVFEPFVCPQIAALSELLVANVTFVGMLVQMYPLMNFEARIDGESFAADIAGRFNRMFFFVGLQGSFIFESSVAHVTFVRSSVVLMSANLCFWGRKNKYGKGVRKNK